MDKGFENQHKGGQGIPASNDKTNMTARQEKTRDVLTPGARNERDTSPKGEQVNEMVFFDNSSSKANKWWDAIEGDLQPVEIGFLLWLADWSFYNTFANMPAAQMQGNDPSRVNALIRIVGQRIAKQPRPSSDLLADFEKSRDIKDAGKMVEFIRSRHFEFGETLK